MVEQIFIEEMINDDHPNAIKGPVDVKIFYNILFIIYLESNTF